MGLRAVLRQLLKYKEPSSAFLNECYSQEGEDCILNRIYEHQVFKDKQTGFFVDVGALHPIQFSNTYKFYKKGWRGINIDALPGSMKAFKQLRSLDVNLEVPISNEKAAIPFYIFKENALNTFSPEVVEERAKTGSKVERVINVETNTLSNILDQYLPASTKIDFLTIDAEGFDFKVLQSNNWQKYRPDILLLESELQLLDFMNSDIYHFMQKNGYTIYAKSVKTYFLKNDSLELF